MDVIDLIPKSMTFRIVTTLDLADGNTPRPNSRGASDGTALVGLCQWHGNTAGSCRTPGDCTRPLDRSVRPDR